MVFGEPAIRPATPADVNIAEMADFSADELARIRELCSYYRLSPASFYIYAAVSKIAAPAIDRTLDARVVHVEYLATRQRRQYVASAGQNWLESFAKDLKTGFHV